MADPPAAAAAGSHGRVRLTCQAHLSACKWGKTADLSQVLSGRSETVTTVQTAGLGEGYEGEMRKM